MRTKHHNKGSNSDKHEIGASEVIGFIIIFGIMIAGIGMVTLYGYPILQKEQQNAEIKNMERAFYVLQTDINSLVYKSIPYRETNLQVMGGTLSVYRPEDIVTNQTIQIQYNDGTGLKDVLDLPKYSDANYKKKFPPGEIRFTSADQQNSLTLENGAINSIWWNTLATEGYGSVMLSKPRWFVDYNPVADTRTVVIPLIQISSDSAKSITAGNSRFEMEIKPLLITSSSSNVNITNPGEVSITYTPNTADPYGRAWYNCMNSLSQSDAAAVGNYSSSIADYTDNSAAFTFTIRNVDYLIVKGYEINLLGI